MRLLATLALVVGLVLLLTPLPMWLVLDQTVATEGYEVQVVDPELFAEPLSLEDFGATPEDPIAVQLEPFGLKAGGLTATEGAAVRFLFVPDDRIVDNEVGTLIVFDRTAGEEMLQSGSVRNLAVLATLVGMLVALTAGLLRWWLGKPAAAAAAVAG